MLTLFDFKKNSRQKEKSTIGIEMRDDGIAIVCRESGDYGHNLRLVNFLTANIHSRNEQLLGEYVRANALSRTACNVVLPQGQYQLLLVDAPEVPDAEMKSALKWKIKDLITLPIEQVALEYFEMPMDTAYARKKMLYVVAADMARLSAIVDLIKNVDLKLKSIDISELVMRNLAINLLDAQFEGRGVAISRLRQGRGSVSVFKKGNLYLSRQFDLEYEAREKDPLPEDILALELQRSLDYYERQMGQAAPGVVYVCGDGVYENKITPSLKSSLMSSIQYLDVGAILSTPASADAATLQRCLGAIGSALRVDGTIRADSAARAEGA